MTGVDLLDLRVSELTDEGRFKLPGVVARKVCGAWELSGLGLVLTAICRQQHTWLPQSRDGSEVGQGMGGASCMACMNQASMSGFPSISIIQPQTKPNTAGPLQTLPAPQIVRGALAWRLLCMLAGSDVRVVLDCSTAIDTLLHAGLTPPSCSLSGRARSQPLSSQPQSSQHAYEGHSVHHGMKPGVPRVEVLLSTLDGDKVRRVVCALCCLCSKR